MALEVDIEKRAGSFHLRAAFSCGKEFLGILGASGSGKSMTLKCIAESKNRTVGKLSWTGKRFLIQIKKSIFRRSSGVSDTCSSITRCFRV